MLHVLMEMRIIEENVMALVIVFEDFLEGSKRLHGRPRKSLRGKGGGRRGRGGEEFVETCTVGRHGEKA